MIDFFQLISNELNLSLQQVKNTISLLDEDKTIPFIARYRKEATYGLDEVQIFSVQERLNYLRNLQDRKESILNSIDEQDKLTDDLKRKIEVTMSLNELEDLYLPYKQKKRTKAMIAREKGLQPLADTLKEQNPRNDDLESICEEYIDFEKDLFTTKDVLKSTSDIIAEEISENPNYRKYIREFTMKDAIISSKVKEDSEESEFKMYFDYSESVQNLPPHRILALLRGESKKVLKLNLETDVDRILNHIEEDLIMNPRSEFAPVLKSSIQDSYKRLIAPSIEREVRQQLKEKAEMHAIEVFGENLKNLLLQAPLPNKVILGFDPGFRTGSKLTVVNEHGEYLEHATIYPHAPQNHWSESKETMKQLIKKYNV